MRAIWIPLVVGLISFAVFYPLGYLTGRRLRRTLKPPCDHQWKVLLEKYPTFIEDHWTCTVCGICEDFPNNKPPVKTTLEVCDMGHAHTVVAPEWEEWPNVVE